MRFKRHLFISYTHKDNTPLFSDGAEGWVSRFHKTLSVVLEQRLGRAPEIWRDLRLQGNEVFTPEIMAQLPVSAVLLAVLSEGYVNSQWCRDEAAAFCAAAEQSGGLTRDNKSRVFKVVKAPPATLDPLPAVMREMTGYDFFERIGSNVPKELDPDFNKASRDKYVDQIMTLAFHLSSLINTLDEEAANDGSASGAGAAKPLVYLAECDHDRRADRAALAIDLQSRGYSVLPDRVLPRDAADYRQAVQAALARCALAVHLVGAHSGWAPDGADAVPGVALQNAESVARSLAGGLRRVVSLPAGTVGSDAPQVAFIQALHTDAQVQRGELITADLEALKTAIFSALALIEQPPPAAPAAAAGSKLLYLVCDPQDGDAVDALGEWLDGQGWQVQVSASSGSAQAVREAHKTQLTQCDAVLVFYGAGSKEWYATALGDVATATAWRQGRAIAATATWLATPANYDKNKRIDRPGYPGVFNGINGISGFDAARAAALGALLDAALAGAAQSAAQGAVPAAVQAAAPAALAGAPADTPAATPAAQHG